MGRRMVRDRAAANDGGVLYSTTFIPWWVLRPTCMHTHPTPIHISSHTCKQQA